MSFFNRYNCAIAFASVATIGYAIVWLDRYMRDDEDEEIEENVPRSEPMSIRSYAWKYQQKIKNGITLRGHSRSAERTCFFWNELSIYFDAGIQGNKPGKFVLLTHGHGDHSASLPLMDVEFDGQPINVLVPTEVEEQANTFTNAFYRLNDATSDLKNSRKIKITPVSPGQKFRFEIKKRQYEIEVFKCHHSVPTVGYGISEIKLKLREQYKKLPGREIGRLRKEGVIINEEVISPIMIYLGDTKASVLKNEKIFNYPVIMIECTFFGEGEANDAIAKSHVHWDHLMPYVKSHPDIKFVLYHFSTKYKERVIDEFFKDVQKNENIKNILAWLG